MLKRRESNNPSHERAKVNPTKRLPPHCKESVWNHINSVYVGSIIRIYMTQHMERKDILLWPIG